MYFLHTFKENEFMKKLFPFIVIFIVLGCNQKEKNDSLKPDDEIPNYGVKFDKILLGVESANSQITLTTNLAIEGQRITLPPGTTLQKIEGNSNTLTYVLPDGYKIVGQNSNGKARLTASGSITCTCTVGKGCSPYVASLGSNTSMGCAKTGNCTKCNMSFGSTRIGTTDEMLSNVEIINFNEPIHFVTTKEELKILISPSQTMMELEEVRQEVVSFAKGYQVDDLEALNKSSGPDDLPSAYTYIHLNVFGRVILLPVQKDLTLSANPMVNELLRDDTNNARVAVVYKCKCNNGTSGCKLNTGSLLLAKAVYCDAGACTSCTLSWL